MTPQASDATRFATHRDGGGVNSYGVCPSQRHCSDWGRARKSCAWRWSRACSASDGGPATGGKDLLEGAQRRALKTEARKKARSGTA